MRIKNAIEFDKGLTNISDIIIKKRDKNFKEVYHLYEFRVKNPKMRNKLVNYLISHKIDAKIHYPVPMHLQPASKNYKYKKGDFPNTEKIANSTISLPAHEFITKSQSKYIIDTIKKFFS